MFFFSQIWGSDVATEENYQGHPILYRVFQNQREIIIQDSKLCFQRRQGDVLLHFTAVGDQSPSDYCISIGEASQLRGFTSEDNEGRVVFCLQWKPEASQVTSESFRYGCGFRDYQQSQNFTRIINQVVGSVTKSKGSRQQRGVQGQRYMQQGHPSPSRRSRDRINQLLMREVNSDNSKVVNSCQLFRIVTGQPTLLHNSAVFTIKSSAPFEYYIVVYGLDDQAISQKITTSMSYNIDVPKGQFRWIGLPDSQATYMAIFDKHEMALNVKFALEECLYQIRNRRPIRGEFDRQETEIKQPVTLMELEVSPLKPPTVFIKMVQEEPLFVEHEMVVIAQDIKLKSIQRKQLQRRLIFQGKTSNRTYICAGQSIDVIKVDRNETIKVVSTNAVHGIMGQRLTPTKMVMHDLGSKAVISSADGKLAYVDLQTFQTIHQLAPSKLPLVDFCPERKLAELGLYSSLIGITSQGLYSFDPKLKEGGSQIIKEYVSNQSFSSIAVRGDGCYSIGSTNGDIRLYNNDGNKSAIAKYPGLGDPVLHIESTKDGKWLLGTFKTYLLLLPTFHQEEDLYNSNSFVKQRPTPQKLVIRPQHLQQSGVEEVQLTHARFDQSRSAGQRFIISGFSQYVVVWSLQRVVNNNTNYTFLKTNNIVSDAEFQFDDCRKIITATYNGVHVQRNNLRK